MRTIRNRSRFSAVAIFASVILLASCSGASPATQQSRSPAPNTPVTRQATPASPTPQAIATPAPAAVAGGGAAPDLKVLKTSPEKGPVGTSISVTGEGLPAAKDVDFQWTAWDGTYVTKVSPDNVEYTERTYTQKRVLLGKAKTDADGKLTATFTVPEDHGELHNFFAVIDGKDTARGGFRIMRSISISSTQGPIGAPITITVTGMAPSYYQSTMAVRWDNRYTGFISTVTTHGTGTARIRAAGPMGDHVIQVYPASHGVPYLNSHEGPNWDIFGHLPDKFTYKVTTDPGAAGAATEWPDNNRVARTGVGMATTGIGDVQVLPGASASVTPGSGPILSRPTLQVDGLPANTDVDLMWVTARGNRARASGWSLDEIPVGKATTGGSGSLRTTFQVPDDLGGWHGVRVMAGSKVLTEASYYVERSLLRVEPKKVKAGEQITIQMKGIGWTEIDNGVAVTYDNAFLGMACGFNSNGNITLYLTATGGPGTHIIDLYPMIYEGHPNKQVFDFEIPQLTALEDQPGLAIGYRLPIFRTAVEVVE